MKGLGCYYQRSLPSSFNQYTDAVCPSWTYQRIPQCLVEEGLGSILLFFVLIMSS